MVPKKQRLRLKPGNSIVGNSFSGKYVKLARSPGDNPRLAVIVSKRVSPSAVKRNLYRRRIQHIWSHLPTVKKSGDLLVIARPGIQSASYQTLREDMINVIGALDRLSSHT